MGEDNEALMCFLIFTLSVYVETEELFLSIFHFGEIIAGNVGGRIGHYDLHFSKDHIAYVEFASPSQPIILLGLN